MKNSSALRYTVLSVCLLVSTGANAQYVPLLERPVTISLNGVRTDEALTRIAQQGGFVFSYNPSVVERERIITQRFVNKTVRQILDALFQGKIQYKTRGNYIILTRAESAAASEPGKVSGYVVDESTGRRLSDVSVYDPISLNSTITDRFGYFEIEMEPAYDLSLAIKKQNYSDTLVMVRDNSGRLMNIPIKFDREKFSTFADSVGRKIKRFWKNTSLFKAQRTNMTNIADTIHRRGQVSLVPFVGSNHNLSGNVVNDYSLNVLGGYAMGTRKLEVGGLFNIARDDITGLQLAGLFNNAGGNLEGVQIGGVFNSMGGRTDGVQVAGVLNFNRGPVKGFTAAGVLNFSGEGSGAAQLAGVGNITNGEQTGFNTAGVFNITTGNAKSQVAGVFNLSAKTFRGWQAAGVFNISAKDAAGLQTAGLFNIAGKKMDGAQVAGLFNYAKRIRGSQVGLLNIADSTGGIPIGLISVVFKGYHKLEVSADEIFHANLAFRTGVHRFYNILTVGARPDSFRDNSTLWSFGYGIGTAPRLSRKLWLNLDLTSSQVVDGNKIGAIDLVNRIFFGIDFQLMKKVSLSAGATINAHITDNTHEGYPDLFVSYQPRFFYDHTWRHETNMKMWWGGKVGIRFL